ncbi:YcxB family protein [Micromonospora soli]|uniref:YcxB family protein n=1 Tax=Micromonospora sp. NBRC 110009 TaxID=3061627 RepID=UPI0026722669|nr:YcxB family protein [Micromonospora sp. NBRC 110009]WKT98165.1 YcxB family protein [Micromonospora sp. NBRC 110009]
MEIRVNKPFDPARLLADLRIIYGDTLHATRSFAVAAVAVGAGGAILLLALSGMSGLVVVLLALAVYGVYLGFGNSRSLQRAVSDLPEICQHEALLIVTEDRIIQEQPSIRSEILWTAITRVVETDAGWLLFYGPRQAISLPREGMDHEQELQFRAHLTAPASVAA